MQPPDHAQDVAHFAAQPRWPAAAVHALEGECRGVLLHDWAAHVRRRFGEPALVEVRAALGPLASQVPDAPDRRAWLPAAAQILLTDAIIHHCLGDRPLDLEPLLRADAAVGMATRLLLRGLGPAAAYRQAAAAATALYRPGTATVASHGDSAVLRLRGSPLFGQPTWRLLQLFGHRAALALLAGDGRGGVHGADAGPDGFDVWLSW